MTERCQKCGDSLCPHGICHECSDCYQCGKPSDAAMTERVDEQRVAFEKWAITHDPGFCDEGDRNTDGTYFHKSTQNFWIVWQAADAQSYDRGVRDATERAGEIDFALIIGAHTTSYAQAVVAGWHWACSCGETITFTDRDSCVEMTRKHWAKAVAAAIRSKE